MAVKLKKISGTSSADNLPGTTADDSIDGGKGTDSMAGGTGNDIYLVDNTGDVVTENASEGTDTIQSSVTLSLSAIANVENLTLTGKASINATGNSLDNVLTGNSGVNRLNAGEGNDTLAGGGGKDIFVFTDLTVSNKTNGIDHISDFTSSQDKIDIDASHMSYLKTLYHTVSGASGKTKIKYDNPDTFNVSSADSTDALYQSVSSDSLSANGVAFVHVLSGSLAGYYVLLNDSTTAINSSDALIGVSTSSLSSSIFV